MNRTQTHPNSLNNLQRGNLTKIECQYCSRIVGVYVRSRHENACELNPKNLKECPVCKKQFGKKGVTCSYSCANTLFRSGVNNGQYKTSGGSYRNICFLTHGKKCIICGEDKIVAVHHMNEDHEDHRPENLVPLCPTHHQYIHSRYKSEILPIVENFIRSYL